MSETTWTLLENDGGLDRMTNFVRIKQFDDKPICYEELRAIIYVHIQGCVQAPKGNIRIPRVTHWYFDTVIFKNLVNAISDTPNPKHSLGIQYKIEKMMIKILKPALSIAKMRDKKHPAVSVNDHNRFR